MAQEILTYIIVGVAFLFLIQGAYRIFSPKKSQDGNENACSSSCNCDSKTGKSKLLERLNEASKK